MKKHLFTMACSLPLALAAFGQTASYPNGNPGDWTALDPVGNTAPLNPTTYNSGGPTGAGYTVINNIFPDQDAGAYSFYGINGFNTSPAPSVSQSLAVYLDPTQPSQQTGGLWIDMTPDATMNTLPYGTSQLWGAENNFRLTGTANGIAVNANGGSTFATITTPGWYQFGITWSQGATGTDPVISTLSIYDPVVGNPFNTLVGSTTYVNTLDTTADNQSQNLGGPGYVWFTEWSNGFADADAGSLEVADLDASPVPEPTTIITGALMLLPFGASTLRFVRKNRAA